MRRASSSSARLASSHIRPHKPGGVIEVVGPGPGLHSVETTPAFTLTSTSQASGSVSSSSSSGSPFSSVSLSTDQGHDGDVLMSYDADEEDQEDDQDRITNPGLDQDSRNSEIQTWYYNLSSHSHHQQPTYSLPVDTTTQSISLDDLDDYTSDEDLSDDAGAPLMSYKNVLNLLADSMESDHDMASDDLDTNLDLDIDNTDLSEHGDEDQYYQTIQNPLHQPFQPTNGFPNLFSAPLVGPSDTLDLFQSPFPGLTAAQMLAMEQEPNPGAAAAAGLEWSDTPHPPAFSNPNPNMLGPGNFGLTDFLHRWARQSRPMQPVTRERGRYPWPNKINELAVKEVTRVDYDDLEGDFCDLQGIDWDDVGVSRRAARERRLLTYENYVNNKGSDRWTPDLPDVAIPRSDNFFRFRRTHIRPDINLAHFQLRNVLATTSRYQSFYPGYGVVHQFNPISTEGRTVMELGDAPGSQVSTMAAGHGVLVAGVFNGEYVLRRIDSDEPEATACHEGIITDHGSGITNHAQIYQARRSSTPVAAFASNDMGFRILDLATETWLSSEMFTFPLNCTAISPDKRLRVVVGDSHNVLIVAAESTVSGGKPEILQTLSGHRDFGFACDWSDDGWSVATGCQDMSVKIWDARRWCDSSGNASPVTTLRSEMAGVRNLRFSPGGSGKRVLVAAEEADFVNIIDAQTFRSKQTIDVFGELGGVSFSNEGQGLNVLCCDRTRGGLLQLERCGFGEDRSWVRDEGLLSQRHHGRSAGLGYDHTMPSPTRGRDVRRIQRERRRAAVADLLEPF